MIGHIDDICVVISGLNDSDDAVVDDSGKVIDDSISDEADPCFLLLSYVFGFDIELFGDAFESEDSP